MPNQAIKDTEQMNHNLALLYLQQHPELIKGNQPKDLKAAYINALKLFENMYII